MKVRQYDLFVLRYDGYKKIISYDSAFFRNVDRQASNFRRIFDTI